MQAALRPISSGQVRLLPGLIQQRADVNRSYLLSLRSENLLQNYYLEAGLWSVPARPEGCHWGWESPTCQLRGHFLGHWLSAAAHLYAARGDLEIKGEGRPHCRRVGPLPGSQWRGVGRLDPGEVL